MKIYLYKNITNMQVTTQNVSTGELYTVSFDLCTCKLLKEYVKNSFYVATSLITA